MKRIRHAIKMQIGRDVGRLLLRLPQLGGSLLEFDIPSTCSSLTCVSI